MFFTLHAAFHGGLLVQSGSEPLKEDKFQKGISGVIGKRFFIGSKGWFLDPTVSFDINNFSHSWFNSMIYAGVGVAFNRKHAVYGIISFEPGDFLSSIIKSDYNTGMLGIGYNWGFHKHFSLVVKLQGKYSVQSLKVGVEWHQGDFYGEEEKAPVKAASK